MHHLYRNALHAALMAFALTARAVAQFDIQDSRTTASLRGIHSLGDGIAWASGTEGIVLRTTDGGLLWQPCTTPHGAEHLDFRGIQAFDENTAIVMSSGKGDLSRLYKTTDGCHTWKLVFTNPDKEGFWDAIQFDERKPYLPTSNQPQRGVLVGDPLRGVFVIYETFDSGESWLRWEGSGGAPPSNMGHRSAKAARDESLFAASNSSVAAPGANGPFLFVTGGKGGSHLFVAEPHSPFDNGTTWKFSTIRLPLKSSDSSGAFSVGARYSHGELSPDLMIVGGDYKEPTNTRGNALYVQFRTSILDWFWSRVIRPQTPPHGYRSAVAYDLTHKTWITVGPNGTDISRDDGRNWTPLQPGPHDPTDADKNWNALSLPFVVGPHGRIGKLRPDALAKP
ncbi:MAG: oxidoreductase [Acidobacteriaceae bacterium]